MTAQRYHKSYAPEAQSQRRHVPVPTRLNPCPRCSGRMMWDEQDEEPNCVSCGYRPPPVSAQSAQPGFHRKRKLEIDT